MPFGKLSSVWEKNTVALPYAEKVLFLIDLQIDWVERQILSQAGSSNVTKSNLEKISWEGKQMELVELIYALHEAKCFGKLPLKTLFTFIGRTFGCEIINYYRLFWDIRNSIGDERTFFLNKLRKILSNKLLRMDGGASL